MFSPVHGYCSVHVSYGYLCLWILLLLVLLLPYCGSFAFLCNKILSPDLADHVWPPLPKFKHFISDSKSLLPSHLLSVFLVWTLHAWIPSQMVLGASQAGFPPPRSSPHVSGYSLLQNKPKQFGSPLCPIVFQNSKSDVPIGTCFAYQPSCPGWYQMLHGISP